MNLRFVSMHFAKSVSLCHLSFWEVHLLCSQDIGTIPNGGAGAFETRRLQAEARQCRVTKAFGNTLKNKHKQLDASVRWR